MKMRHPERHQELPTLLGKKDPLLVPHAPSLVGD
jgi:hypothetical protein